jgi:D-tyrosyl-tRNA(Tyr) deacylase
MRLVLQRASYAAVSVNGGEPLKTGKGLAILAGFIAGDDDKTAAYMAEKAANLRVFDDENGNLNLSLLDIGGDCLCVSNFTLYADCKKGRRPSFINAAPPQISEPVYEKFVLALRNAGVKNVVTGTFGAEMLVEIQNDGPVTIILDSAEIMPKGVNK